MLDTTQAKKQSPYAAPVHTACTLENMTVRKALKYLSAELKGVNLSHPDKVSGVHNFMIWILLLADVLLNNEFDNFFWVVRICICPLHNLVG